MARGPRRRLSGRRRRIRAAAAAPRLVGGGGTWRALTATGSLAAAEWRSLRGMRAPWQRGRSRFVVCAVGGGGFAGVAAPAGAGRTGWTQCRHTCGAQDGSNQGPATAWGCGVCSSRQSYRACGSSDARSASGPRSVRSMQPPGAAASGAGAPSAEKGRSRRQPGDAATSWGCSVAGSRRTRRTSGGFNATAPRAASVRSMQPQEVAARPVEANYRHWRVFSTPKSREFPPDARRPRSDLKSTAANGPDAASPHRPRCRTPADRAAISNPPPPTTTWRCTRASRSWGRLRLAWRQQPLEGR